MNLAEPQEVLLLGPGPSPVDPQVLRALSWKTLGHLDPEFLVLMDQTTDLLRYVFETENKVTLPISGTGSAGMEAAVVNMIEPGDKMIVCVNGLFGVRMADVAERCGAEVIEVKAEWGKPIDAAVVEKALDSNKGVKIVGVVHAETSTGVLQPLEPLVELVHNAGSLILVDTVTSLGGLPVQVDERGLDVVYSGTQKCLSCPPGLAPLTLNNDALNLFNKRSSKVKSWHLDLSMLTQYWGSERFYHHTAPVNMIYGLYAALSLIKEEGLEARFDRHRINSAALASGLEAMNMSIFIPEEFRLPSLVTVKIPESINDADVRKRLRMKHRIEIGGGLGELKGKIWRVGLMGSGSKIENVEKLLKALSEELNELGHPCSASDAVAAARSSL